MRDKTETTKIYGAAFASFIHSHLTPVMRNKITYEITWKNEDTNRVSSKEFTDKDGKDHSAMDEALELAQQADGNMWPWVLERDGQEIAEGWGGDQLNRGRLFPTCG